MYRPENLKCGGKKKMQNGGTPQTDPPYIYKDKSGRKQLNVGKIPLTNDFEADKKWLDDWMIQRYRKFRNFSKDEYEKDNVVAMLFGTNQNDINSTAHDMKEKARSFLNSVKIHDPKVPIPEDTYLDAAYGVYQPAFHRIYFPLGQPDKEVVAHELTHATGLSSKEGVRKYMKSVLDKDPMFNSVSEDNSYYKDPDEIYSRIMGIRRGLNMKPTDVVTPEYLKRKREENPNYNDQRIPELMTDESLIKLLNDLVYKNQPSNYGKYGGMMKSKYQDGGIPKIIHTPNGPQEVSVNPNAYEGRFFANDLKSAQEYVTKQSPKPAKAANSFPYTEAAITGFSMLGNLLDKSNSQFTPMPEQPKPYQQFQPNPFSLYAKYGGSIRTKGSQFVYRGKSFSNNAQMDMDKYQQGGLTQGLIPTPRYPISILNQRDSIDYLDHFNAMRKQDPIAVKSFNTLNRIPLMRITGPDLTESEKEAFWHSFHELQAYQDAMNPNVMTDAQVKAELLRPLSNSQRIKRKK